MYDDEQYYDEMGGQMGPNQLGPGQQQPMEPPIDPWELEQIRQEVELAHEEFQRLLEGRPRLYSRF